VEVDGELRDTERRENTATSGAREQRSVASVIRGGGKKNDRARSGMGQEVISQYGAGAARMAPMRRPMPDRRNARIAPSSPEADGSWHWSLVRDDIGLWSGCHERGMRAVCRKRSAAIRANRVSANAGQALVRDRDRHETDRSRLSSGLILARVPASPGSSPRGGTRRGERSADPSRRIRDRHYTLRNQRTRRFPRATKIREIGEVGMRTLDHARAVLR